MAANNRRSTFLKYFLKTEVLLAINGALLTSLLFPYMLNKEKVKTEIYKVDLAERKKFDKQLVNLANELANLEDNERYKEKSNYLLHQFNTMYGNSESRHREKCFNENARVSTLQELRYVLNSYYDPIRKSNEYILDDVIQKINKLSDVFEESYESYSC